MQPDKLKKGNLKNIALHNFYTKPYSNPYPISVTHFALIPLRLLEEE